MSRLSCLGCVSLSCVLVQVVPRVFVCAWVSCFGFAFSRFATDLSAGLSESARCALGRQGARCSRRLLLSTGVICVLMLRVCCVELAWVDLGWFGLSCWVVVFSCACEWMCLLKLCSRVALRSVFFVQERGHERPKVRGCRDARAAFLAGLCACVCVSACVM